MITGLDHLQLAMPADGEAIARDFYGRLLGLTELAKPAGLPITGAWFALPDGRQLHLGVEGDFRPALKAHPALAAADLDALAAVLAADGRRVEWDERLDRRRFYSSDPFGNRLEFIEAG